MHADRPTPTLRTLWVIYFAFCAAAVIYAVIGRIVMTSATNEPQPYPMPLTTILAVVAGAVVVAAYIIPRGTWARAGAKRLKDPVEAMGLYQTGMIMHWACLEAVAILGLVLCVITTQWLPSLVGSVVSLAFLATARPQPGRMGIMAD